MTDEYGLHELHSQLLAQMKDIDWICRSHGIPYSLHGGTLLGAVREKGFIPWDDDLDIVMTRDAFEKFAVVYRSERRKGVLDTSSTWLPRVIPHGSHKHDEGMPFVDIFIYDSISENPISANLKINLLRMLQGMLKENTQFGKFKLVHRILLRTTRFVGRFFSKRRIIWAYDYVAQHTFKGTGQSIHRSNDSYKAVGQIWDRSIMDGYADLAFEDASFMVVSRYEEVLTRWFGLDFMIPPPVAERVPNHKTQRMRYGIGGLN